jgi:malonate transporter and related proteins
MNTFLLLLPDLSLIAFGFLLYRITQWGDSFWAGLEKLVYYVLFPVLLFHAIVTSEVRLADAVPFSLAVGALVVTGVLLASFAGRLFQVDERRLASSLQCAFRFNSYVLMAIAQRLAGAEGVALSALAVAIAVPSCNIVAVWHLSRHAPGGFLKEVVKNPLILGTVAGLAGNLGGLELPEPVSAFMARLGAAALALGLLAVGAGLRPSGASGDRAFAAYLTAIKLLALPLAALGLAIVLQLPVLATQVLVLYAAMPTASSCYILANRMGGDGPYVAMLIMVSTLASVAALPFWLSWVM